MKNFIKSLFVMLLFSFNSMAQTDLIITTEVCSSASEVRLTGPFWSWNPTTGPIAVDNGDGTWTFTLSPAPAVDMEYLLIVDGVQENLIAAMAAGGTCAPVTDYANYANRRWQTTDALTVSNTYGQCTACTPASTDLIITTEVCSAASSVRLTGPFWSWDPTAGPIAVNNGDGTWTFTLSPAPAADMEYLLIVDGVQENLIADMAGGGTCAPITDYANYANRIWYTTDPLTISNTYDQCVACTPVSTDLIITTEVCSAASSVRLTGPFWSWDPTAGPIAVDNGDGTWTFTLSPAPAADMEYLLIVDGVQENLIADMAGGGTCAPITDYANYANRIWYTTDPLTISNTYDQCVACAPVSTDLVITTEVCSSASEVRLTGPFWSWDPTAGPIAVDNGDGTWTFTLSPAPAADMEYLLIVDGVQENLIADMAAGGTCAPITDNANYANRIWYTTDPLTISNTYDQCVACAPVSTGLLITVDVCSTTASEVRMTGPFWNWDPAGGPIASDNGDGTWTFNLDPAPSVDMEYLIIVDGVQENLITDMQNGGTCAPVTNYDTYANRKWIVGSGDVNISYDRCVPCSYPDLEVIVEVCTPATQVNLSGAMWLWNPAFGPQGVDNGDGTWTITLSPVPNDTLDYLIVKDGIMENLVADMQNGAGCAPITDYSTYANRRWLLGQGTIAITYDQCGPCLSGLSELEANEVSTYPNPTEAIVTMSSNSKISTIIVYSVVGEVVAKYTNLSKSIADVDLTNLKAGVYTFDIQTAKGSEKVRIVKK